MWAAGREINDQEFGDYRQVQQVHRIGDQADMGEKPYEDLRAFPDTVKFWQQQKTRETFWKDQEHFREIQVWIPVDVKDDVHDQNSQEEKQVLVPSPEMKMPVLQVSSENAECYAVETEDHHFLDSSAEVKFIYRKPGCNEDP